jgi:hypothetical protein
VKAQAKRVELAKKPLTQRGQDSLTHLGVEAITNVPHEHTPDYGNQEIREAKRNGPPPHVGRHRSFSKHPIDQPADRKNLESNRKAM